MKRIILVGLNSFIGKHLVIRLDDDKIPNIGLSQFSNQSEFKLNLLDVDNFNFNLIEENDFVVFCAAISSPDICQNNFKESFHINVIGTIQFIEQSMKRGAKVLFFSSDTVYGNAESINNEECNPYQPIGEYAMMKLTVENYFRHAPLFKVFRLSYVFSWQDKFMSYLHNCRVNSTTAEIYHPFLRKMVYIEDIIDGVIFLYYHWDNTLDQQFFNFCGNKHYSRLDIVQLYCKYIKQINYNIIQPTDSFLMARPEKIYVSSKFSNILLAKSFTPIEKAITIEKQKYYQK